MAVLGFDLSSLRDALGQLQTSVRQGVQQAQPASGQPDYLGYLGSVGAASGMQGPAMQAIAHPAPQSVSGLLGGGAAYDTLAQMAQVGPSLSQAALGSLYQQASSVPSSLSSTWDSLTAFASQQAQNAAQKAAAAAATGASGEHYGYPAGGGPSTGMEAGVAQWATQAQQTFGGIMDPDIMLAIMTNESHGVPGAKNPDYPAYGLFQLVGFGDHDPNWASNTNGQFQAARQLAQEKLTGINAAYAANGLNPDARTRARDFALAWAGHFDYSTGTPNPNSRDVASGQTAQQLGDIFLANYDRIKAGRQAPAANAGGVLGAAASLVGTPYVLGGLRAHPNNPEQGLDCSEFTAWAYGRQGVTLPPNAQAQFNSTARVDFNAMQPGDLVFFQGTDPSDPDPITHVGIFVGNVNGKPTMLNAQDNGVQYADLSSAYWQGHYAGSGRVGGQGQ